MPEPEMSSCRAPRKFDGLRHAAALRYPSFRERAQNQAGMEHVDLTFSSWSGAVLTDASPGTARSERRPLARVCHFCQLAVRTNDRDQPQRARRQSAPPIVPSLPHLSPERRHSFCHVMPTLSSPQPLAEREAPPILRYATQHD